MPALLRSSIFYALMILFSGEFFIASAGADQFAGGEEFWEELLLRPLPDRKVLSHFHFRSRAPPSESYGRHHHLFPKAVAQLVHKFRIRELELSFTQGRWNYENWGGSDPLSNINSKPPGVELWASFDLPIDEIDYTWRNLTHALSGLFCASVNFLESSTSYTSPYWGFRSNSSNLRYGALPREAVCTENLTPWLKLLPCRDKAGLASLLDRPSLYRGYYHSQRLHLSSTKSTGIVLDQTLTVVFQPKDQRTSPLSSSVQTLQPSWSINSLFRKKLTSQCALAKFSKIYVELEKDLIAELDDKGYVYSWKNPVFELTSMPDRVTRESNSLEGQRASVIYEYEVAIYNETVPLNPGIVWKLPLIWSCLSPPFHVSRFLMGSGNEKGSIAFALQSTQFHESSLSIEENCTVQVVIFQVVPWYVKVYYHTLQILIDGEAQIVSDVVEKIRVSPSEDKVTPGTLEVLLRFPCTMLHASLTLDFDKAFLHIDEYPPDANQGFDLPSALVRFPQLYSRRSYTKDDSSKQSPMLSTFDERNSVLSYTELLLVPLTTPDFSMPYNVITFTCTVLALYFGSLFNALRRRIGEEERLLKKKDGKQGLIPRLLTQLSSKLIGKRQPTKDQSSSSSLTTGSKAMLLKALSIAALAVIWHYYFNR